MVMVSVHSIVGWDFGMALVPGWHSSIIAPYFVVGAVHSGLGMVVIGLYLRTSDLSSARSTFAL